MAPVAQLSEHLHLMQEDLGSNPQIDTMKIHSTKCDRLEFFRSIYHNMSIASNDVDKKTVLRLKHVMIDRVSQ